MKKNTFSFSRTLILASLILAFYQNACAPSARTRSEAIPVVQTEQPATRKNVILLIGDGMGLTQISAAMFRNQNRLNLERCTHLGIHKPAAADDLITDSAAGATAFATGHKTKNGYLGLDASGRAHETILERAQRMGFVSGLITTSTLLHATPAAFAAHQPDRDSYEAIALDMSRSSCNLMIGGGKRYFDRRKTDSLTLSDSLRSKGYFVTDYFENDFGQYKLPAGDKLVYFTADGDPLPFGKGRDYLPKATSEGIGFLNRIRGSKGFFLMVEGAQIDWGGHANETEYLIDEMLDFDRAIGAALDFAQKDGNTLVIVTGDHETGGMAINPGSGPEGLVVSYSTLKHTGTLIPVFAYGPGASSFSGIYENTQIYFKIKSFLLDGQ